MKGESPWSRGRGRKESSAPVQKDSARPQKWEMVPEPALNLTPQLGQELVQKSVLDWCRAHLRRRGDAASLDTELNRRTALQTQGM